MTTIQQNTVLACPSPEQPPNLLIYLDEDATLVEDADEEVLYFGRVPSNRSDRSSLRCSPFTPTWQPIKSEMLPRNQAWDSCLPKTQPIMSNSRFNPSDTDQVWKLLSQELVRQRDIRLGE